MENYKYKPYGQQESDPTPFDVWFQRLKDFKEENGHLHIFTLPETPLSKWATRIRRQYESMKKGEETSLTLEQIKKLKEIGLQLTFLRKKSFDESAAEWLEYRTMHGRDPPPDSGFLGQWVIRIRRRYRKLQSGQRSSLTQEQADRLTTWGFRWDTGHKPGKQQSEKKTWDDRFQELLEFKNEYGDVNVPQKYGSLGGWVQRQRKEYVAMKDGKKHNMTKEKLEKLKSVGFVFLTRKRPITVLNKLKSERGDVESDSSSDDDRRSRGDDFPFYSD